MCSILKKEEPNKEGLSEAMVSLSVRNKIVLFVAVVPSLLILTKAHIIYGADENIDYEAIFSSTEAKPVWIGKPVEGRKAKELFGLGILVRSSVRFADQEIGEGVPCRI